MNYAHITLDNENKKTRDPSFKWQYEPEKTICIGQDQTGMTIKIKAWQFISQNPNCKPVLYIRRPTESIFDPVPAECANGFIYWVIDKAAVAFRGMGSGYLGVRTAKGMKRSRIFHYWIV